MFFLISERGYIDKSAPRGGVKDVLLFEPLPTLYVLQRNMLMLYEVHNALKVLYELVR